MKRTRVIGFACVAFAAFALIVASASAETPTFLLALWLKAGVAVKDNLAVETTASELEIVNHNALGVGITARELCSWILDGTVGAESAGSITGLLNLAKEPISSIGLEGLALECIGDENCENPKVWTEELPWKTELELLEETAGTFFVDLLSGFSYYVQCGSFFGEITELCVSTLTAIQVSNETGGTVDATFSDPFQELAGLKLGACSGRVETFEVTGLGLIALVNKEALTVSE